MAMVTLTIRLTIRLIILTEDFGINRKEKASRFIAEPFWF